MVILQTSSLSNTQTVLLEYPLNMYICLNVLGRLRLDSTLYQNSTHPGNWRQKSPALNLVPVSSLLLSTKQGQSHEKVGKTRPWDVSLGPNYKSRSWFLKFSDRPLNSYNFLRFTFCLREYACIFTVNAQFHNSKLILEFSRAAKIIFCKKRVLWKI
jgi:hypothetical protein